MPFDVVSGTTRKDLLTQIRTFALANGWASSYNDIVATGEMGISNSNAFVALGDGGTASRTDSVNGGTLTDGLLNGGGMGTGLTAGNLHYYGHPGSIVSTNGDADRLVVNDLAGPFSNIYLFCDTAETYLHCVVQSSANRYTFLSMGNLDKRGLSHADIGYLVGMFYTWWPNSSDFTQSQFYGPNHPGALFHSLGFLGQFSTSNAGKGGLVYAPSGVLDTALGFTSGARAVTLENIADAINLPGGESAPSSALLTGDSRFLDHYWAMANDQTTGGVPLWPIPYVFHETSGDPACYLGDLPDVRLVSLTGLAPKDIISFGADDWQVFPIKAASGLESMGYGASPIVAATTGPYGIAIKRVA